MSLTNRYLHWSTSSTWRDQPGLSFWKGKPQAVTCMLPHRQFLVQHCWQWYYKTSGFVSCACWHPCAPHYCMAPGGNSDILSHAKMQNISSSSWTIALIMEKVMKCTWLLCGLGTLKARFPKRSRVLKISKKTLRPASLLPYSVTSSIVADLRTSIQSRISAVTSIRALQEQCLSSRCRTARFWQICQRNSSRKNILVMLPVPVLN